LSFFSELKRRNVIRVALAYLVMSWLILQVSDVILGNIDAPQWIFRVILLLLACGLPPVLLFAWAFELTPEGLKRDSDVVRSQSITARTGRKLDFVIIGVLVVAVGVLLADRFYGTESAGAPSAVNSRAERAPARGKISVAVLPFVNMSDDEQNEYFSDGISEELLNVLVGIDGLRVPSRTSSFTFKGNDQKLSEIGRQLGVDNILEGSVRKDGDRIRVTAQLVDVNTDTHLWSETYTRKLDDIFAVQDEIARAIVAALEITLSGGDEEKLGVHSTSNVAAYNKYLQGRHLWNQRSPRSLLAAIEPLREAVELDPGFSQAWAALADTYVLLPEYGVGSVSESIPLAREATQRALAIDPDSARALTTSGYYKASFDYDWDGANRDFAKAIALEPGYATAHHWFGEVLVAEGRLDEALEQLQAAAEADPLSAVIRHVPGYLLLYSNRLDEAEAQYMSALELDPNFIWTYQNLDMLYTLRGDYAKARNMAKRHAELKGSDAAPDLARIDAIENPELKPRALALLEQRQDILEGVFGKAMQYVLLGELDLALNSLERAFEAGDAWSIHMNWVFVYEPLRGNPRFQAMLKKMHQQP
jgi:TolB-like protein/tetratricopeptide (TPR) repeat protein